jgi:hypothetical protein
LSHFEERLFAPRFGSDSAARIEGDLAIEERVKMARRWDEKI